MNRSRDVWKKIKRLPASALLLSVLMLPQRAKAPPPLMEDMRQLPGKSAGTTKTYWVAPFVKVSEEQVGGSRTKSVTWYSKDGPVKTRTVDNMQTGFIYARENGKTVILGINEDWEFVLPREVDPNDVMATAFVHCDEGGHVFIHEFSPNRKEVSMKFYVDGKLANQLGPFVDFRYSSIEQCADGAAAFLIKKAVNEEGLQIVTTDSKGQLAMRVDCDAAEISPVPAPDGVGALLQGLGATDQRNFFTWYTPEGKVRAMEISPNPYCIGWVPATQKSLFSTSIGYEHRYRMVDWATGRELWDIPCPGGGQSLSVAITPRLVIFAVAELYKGGPWSGTSWVFGYKGERTEWIRDFYAVGVNDGQLVARWRAHYTSRMSNDYEHFVWHGNQLYYVTPEEFVELSEEDILTGKSGWERDTGSQK